MHLKIWLHSSTCIQYSLSFIDELYICLFLACLGFIVPLENVSLIWRRHYNRWRAANFDFCSAIIGHLRGPETHIYCRTFICGAVTTGFYYLGLSQLGLANPTFRLQGQRLNPLHHLRCMKWTCKLIIIYIYTYNNSKFCFTCVELYRD